MPKPSPFTVCPRCGHATVHAVYCCVQCGYVAPRQGTATGIALTAVTLALMALILYLAWRRFGTPPPPFLGTWTDGRVFFTLNPDRTAETNAVFIHGDAESKFEVGSRSLQGHWSAIAGLLRLSLPIPTSRAFEPPQLLQWSLARDDQLTLTRVDRFGTLGASVILHRRRSAPNAR